MGNSFTHFKRIMLISLLTFIAYSNSFNSAFHFDDFSSIITYPYIKSVHNIPYFFYYKGAPLTGRPVTTTTFAVNYWIGGLRPSSYHHVNFFIHLANIILVYILLLFTLKDRVGGYMEISLVASLIFAVHPIQTQAVTYIVQRAEILSAFFCLLSLILFIKARTQNTPSLTLPPRGGGVGGGDDSELRTRKRRASRYTLYALSLVSAILAMGSKEIAVTLPVIILLYDFFFIADGDIKALSKRWVIHVLFFLALVSLAYFMGAAQFRGFITTNAVKPPPTSSVYVDTSSISRYEYLLTQFRVIWTYIRLLILPVNQNVDYNYPLSHGLLTPITTLFGGIGIIVFLTSAVLFFKRMRSVSFFIVWFFLMLAPTSSVAVLPDVIFEHRLYLASAGFFVIFTIALSRASDIIFGKGKE